MKMMARSVWLVAFVLLTTSSANAAPQSLYGKTIVVNWTEERQQKEPGEQQIRSIGASAEFDVYVSEAGRAFNRLRMSVANSRGELKSGNRDRVKGDGGAQRNVAFAGNTMTASMARGSGGALSVSVTFDDSFQSCTARTVSGKSKGVISSKTPSFINGGYVEIISVKTSGESCRIQAGNIFGN